MKNNFKWKIGAQSDANVANSPVFLPKISLKNYSSIYFIIIGVLLSFVLAAKKPTKIKTNLQFIENWKLVVIFAFIFILADFGIHMYQKQRLRTELESKRYSSNNTPDQKNITLIPDF